MNLQNKSDKYDYAGHPDYAAHFSLAVRARGCPRPHAKRVVGFRWYGVAMNTVLQRSMPTGAHSHGDPFSDSRSRFVRKGLEGCAAATPAGIFFPRRGTDAIGTLVTAKFDSTAGGAGARTRGAPQSPVFCGATCRAFFPPKGDFAFSGHAPPTSPPRQVAEQKMRQNEY
jgi:hypothetical protein